MSRINGFVGRRNFLKLVGLSIVSIGAVTACNRIISDRQEITIPDTNPNPNPVSINEAENRLIAGNRRFINQNRRYPNQSKRRLQSVARQEYPFAAILACADSRVPPEIIFDQGLGDLFVVRLAGNIASNEAINSLEYATANLGTQLIVVLGHKRCDTIDQVIKNERISGNIGIVDGMRSDFDQNQQKTDYIGDFNDQYNQNDRNGFNNQNDFNDRNNRNNRNDFNDRNNRNNRNDFNDRNNRNNPNDFNDGNENAVITNIRYQTEKMQRNSAVLSKLISTGRLKIIGAFYDIDTGKVNFIS